MQMQHQAKLLILTENPVGLRAFFRRLYHRAARLIKKVLFQFYRAPRLLPYGGPDAVAASLYRGLTLQGVDYSVNQRATADTVCVLADPEALRYAIRAKEAGVFKKVVAGPNVVHNPNSEAALIRHPSIDAIVVPSQWNKDWWVSMAPELAPRLHPWPAGVSEEIRPSSHVGGAIVYVKSECGMTNALIAHLEAAGLPTRVLRYGTFTHEEYLESLRTARILIYLSQAESQGVALSEAWMADVPTLVWNPGFFSINGFEWRDPALSAPYLTPDCGAFFTNTGEFSAELQKFLAAPSLYAPRNYCARSLSDAASAARYLSIINADTVDRL
jgi:hypothetical protein